jgi:hypothetical protein
MIVIGIGVLCRVALGIQAKVKVIIVLSLF